MKNDKNAKNKISFKSTLSKKSIKPLKPERINIQTITKPKNNTYNFLFFLNFFIYPRDKPELVYHSIQKNTCHYAAEDENIFFNIYFCFQPLS